MRARGSRLLRAGQDSIPLDRQKKGPGSQVSIKSLLRNQFQSGGPAPQVTAEWLELARGDSARQAACMPGLGPRTGL
jgi:hypothetical protein